MSGRHHIVMTSPPLRLRSGQAPADVAISFLEERLPRPLRGPRNDGRGIVLLGALIILLTISLIGATLASFFFSVNTVAEVELSRAQALYLAEAGIANAVQQLHQGGLSGDVEQHLGPTSLGEGEYEVTHDPAAGLITATGKVRGVKRTIQVKYLPF